MDVSKIDLTDAAGSIDVDPDTVHVEGHIAGINGQLNADEYLHALTYLFTTYAGG